MSTLRSIAIDVRKHYFISDTMLYLIQCAFHIIWILVLLLKLKILYAL